MWRRALAFAMGCLWPVLAVVPAHAQSDAPKVQASATPYDWQSIVRHFRAIEAAVLDSPDDPQATVGDSLSLSDDFRLSCAEELGTFARKLVLSGCPDAADCRTRRGNLAETARGLADETPARIQVVNGDARAFLHSGLALTSSVPEGPEALRLRSAHDQWFRGWLDPLAETRADSRTQSDRELIMNKVWCAVTRDNAEAAIAYLAASGFPSDGPGGDASLVPALINIAIHAAWDPALTAPFRIAGDQAFSAGRLSGHSAAYLVDIDTMAAMSHQRVGVLWSCEGDRAYVDPPLIDEGENADLRERYGLPPLAAALESRSQRCR